MAEKAKSVEVAEKGIRNSHDFVRMMSLLMSDLSTGRITPKVADSICNAGGKMPKVIELEHKYGSSSAGGRKLLELAAPEKTADSP